MPSRLKAISLYCTHNNDLLLVSFYSLIALFGSLRMVGEVSWKNLSKTWLLTSSSLTTPKYNSSSYNCTMLCLHFNLKCITISRNVTKTSHERLSDIIVNDSSWHSVGGKRRRKYLKRSRNFSRLWIYEYLPRLLLKRSPIGSRN